MKALAAWGAAAVALALLGSDPPGLDWPWAVEFALSTIGGALLGFAVMMTILERLFS